MLLQTKTGGLVFLLPFLISASPVESTLNSLDHLSQVGKPACAASVTPTPVPVEAVKYDCKMIPIGESVAEPIAPLKKTESKGDQISFFQDNDNTMLVFMEYGNDLGYTNGLGLTYLKQLDSKKPEKNKTLTFDLTSELYTEEKTARPKNGKNYAVEFVDVSRLRATYQQGEKFYFLMGVGIEDRQTKPTKNDKLTPEAKIQEWWHETFNLDLNQYDPAVGTATRFSRTSLLANAGVGKNTRLYEGRCQVNLGAGVSLSTEDKTPVGQNSNASVEGGVKADLIRSKKSDARFTAGMDASMMYFPVGAGNEKFGARGRLSLTGNINVGKNKKNNLQPFLTFTLPLGRQVFAPMNDPEVIQRLGLRFIFGK